MSSEEEPDLPVTALVLEDNTSRHFNIKAKIVDWAPLETSPEDELVKHQDAQEAIKEARQQERQKILIRYEDILEEELNEHGFKRKSYRQALERLIDEIADKTEELRDELEEEVDES